MDNSLVGHDKVFGYLVVDTLTGPVRVQYEVVSMEINKEVWSPYTKVTMVVRDLEFRVGERE